VPRSYAQRTPKKMKAAALRGALSDRAGHGRLAVVSAFVEGGVPSTKEALTVLRTAVGATAARFARPVLVVVHADDEMTRKSLRNVPHVRVLDSGQLNTYDVLACDHVVFTQAALAEFVARAGGGELVTVDKPAAKQARASTRKAAAGDDGEPAPEAGETKAAAGDDGEPGPEAGATKAAAEDGGEPGAEGTDEAKPARASRARKPATAGAGKPADGEESDAGPTGVTQRSSGTSGETASSGSGAEQKEEQE
jgi:hypothetical protein